MPTYEFKNRVTGEVTEVFMKISEKDQYLLDNPRLTSIISSPNFITRSDGDVLKKAGDGWKEVQDKVKATLPPRYKDKVRTK